MVSQTTAVARALPGITWRVQVRPWVREHAREAPLAAAVSSSFFISGFADVTFGLFLGLLGLAVVVTGTERGERWAFGLLALIGVSAVTAVAASVYGSGLWVHTTWLAVWVLMGVTVYMVKKTAAIMHWIVPAFGIASTAIYLDGADGRAKGLLVNPNPAAGLMLLAAVYLLVHERTRWLAMPVLAAIPLTGSRWAVAVAAMVLAAMVVRRLLPMKHAAFIMAGALVLTLAGWGEATDALRLDRPVLDDVIFRSTINTVPGLLPAGIIQGDQTHFAPIRVAAELGIVGAIAWVGLMALAIRRTRHQAVRWLLGTTALLMVMDVYFWMPANIVMLWWLLVSLGAKGDSTWSRE